jgi:hypothetical protein
MQLLHSRNPWSLRYGPDPTINFCFWVLLLDGLRVPPFDQHLDGDGSLRDLGLTEASWQAWFLRVIDPQQRKQDEEQLQQQSLAEYLKMSGEPDLEHLSRRMRAEQLKMSKDPPLPPPPEYHHYHASWKGSMAARNRLIELQEPYKQVYHQYDRTCNSILRTLLKEEHRSEINLYDELKPYHTRLPALAIHFVEYEYPLDYLVPPATLIMTVQEGQPDFQEFRERVLAGAAELAAQASRRSKPSRYIRIARSDGQPAAAYCRHGHKPVLPQPAKQTVPRLADAARQLVFEELADEDSFYGPVDFATVQFLREKNRPGWRLYEISFQEIDGEQHRQIFILQQNEDGSWSSNVSGGSSGDMQNEWPKLAMPVHDHPLIFLSANGMNLDNQLYLLTAHGHVIDNGFHVERVRLVNDAGQILEDTVEEGSIFVACKPEDLVQLPMQAELYDHQGRLVWQQTVTIDGGLPSWQKGRQKE